MERVWESLLFQTPCGDSSNRFSRQQNADFVIPDASPYPGRKPVEDRVALAGISFVLKTGIRWEDLRLELGCSGMTCWRRLRDWNRAGVWQNLHQVLLSHLRHADRINWQRAIIDSASLRATARGDKTGPNPTDRAKYGSKHHLGTDARSVILSTCVTAANRNDTTELPGLVDAIPPVRGKRGRANVSLAAILINLNFLYPLSVRRS